MSARVLLFAASGPALGAGHVMRTRAVAQALVGAGARPLLVVGDAATAERLAGEGFEVALAGDPDVWSGAPPRAVWIDLRGGGAEVLSRARAHGTRTVLVEERGPLRELADLVVYPSLHHRDDAWDRAHADRVRSGAAWIPLSRELLAVPAAEKDVDVLVTFGGSDPNRLTERCLALLDRSAGRVAVSVGAHMADRRPTLARLARERGATELLPDGALLGPWMARSRAALTAVGTTLYELAYLRVPALILANYDADAEALGHYRDHGPHRPLGVAHALGDDELAHRMGEGLGEGRAGVWEASGLGSGARALARLLLG